MIADAKREALRLRQDASQESERLANERSDLENEKASIMVRIQEVQRRADEAVEAQTRLRRGVIEEKVAERFSDPYSSGGGFGGGGGGALVPLSSNRMASHNNSPMSHNQYQHSSAGGYHLDLARQRAVLNRLTSK